MTHSKRAIAESIASMNIVAKNITEKSAENDENVASVSGMTANARDGPHWATCVTSTPFLAARYHRVPNIPSAESIEINVFPSATYITDFAISDFGFLNAPYTIIAHIAIERVKNICPAAAVQVLSAHILSESKLNI